MSRGWLVLFAGCARDLSGDLDPGPPGGTATEEGVTVIDARSETEAVGFDLDTGAVVALTDPAWDLSFLRFEIRLNSGASGDGTVEAVVFDGVAYADLVEVPLDGWAVDLPDADGDGVDELVFLAWYDYDYVTHLLSPADRVYAVRSGLGATFRVGFRSYYDDAGTPAIVTFDWGPLPPEGETR